MAFSGGVFSRVFNWVTDRTNGVNITASRMDQEFDGIATGLSNCILKDGTQTVTANIPMNSKKFTGLADPSATGDSVHYGTLPCVITSTGSKTAAASQDFTIPTGYQWVELVLDNIIMSSSGANLNGRISTDGGSSYLSSALYIYAQSGIDHLGAVTSANASIQTQAVLLVSATSSSAHPASMRMRVATPTSTTARKLIRFESTLVSSASTWGANQGFWAYDSNDDITNIRILASAGTVACNYRVIGWR